MSPLLETFGFSSVRGYRGAGGAAAGSYELISTAFGTGASNTITFSSIPSTYKHLQIRFAAKATDPSYQTALFVRINGDVAANYSNHMLWGNGTSVAAENVTSSSYLFNAFSLISAQTEPGSTVGTIDILDYASTTKNKTARYFAGHVGAFNGIRLISGLWRSTVAVSSIGLTTQTNNFTTNTRFSLYGIKG